MIVVIADDLTGAAELAGAAHQRGLRAEIQTRFDTSSPADLVAIDTDTRSLSPDQAARQVAELARVIQASNPDWIYKKTDSVLRGNVRHEIEALLEVTGHTRSMFVPANPSKGRLIRDGQYFVNGVPLNETAFAQDPDHPRKTASVAELLGPASRIQIPDIGSASDVTQCAGSVDDQTLPAGGVDFFGALLALRAQESSQQVPCETSAVTTLFVCGSAAAWMNGRASQFAERHLPHVTVGSAAFGGAWTPESESALGSEMAAMMQCSSRGAVAVGRPVQHLPFAPAILADRLCSGVVKALGSCNVDRICVEGGATGAALLKRLGWTRLQVVRQWAGGVVELRALDHELPTLVLKVGSYDWPAELF